MSDMSQGPGWWLASDGKWYPPEAQPDWSSQAQPPTFQQQLPPLGHAEDALASWAPTKAQPMYAPAPEMVAAHTVPGGYPNPESFQGPATVGFPPAGSGHQPISQPIMTTSSGGRFSRGIRLVGVGFAMARDEPGLMMVPIIAFFVQMVIIGLATLAVWPSLEAARNAAGSDGSGLVHLTPSQWAIMVAAGVATMFVSVVSHATIIARVMAHFHGQEVSNTKAARAALTKSPQLFAWAFINYVVVSVLRSFSNRGILGAIVGSLLRAGWMLASFFVVPVILFEDKGAIAAIKRSVHLCRSRWGENIVGNGALGLIGIAALLLDVAVAVLVGSVFAPLGVAVGMLGLIIILLVLTVASGAFNAALYWFAVTEQAPGQYSLGDLQSAYRPKPKRTGIYGF